MYEKDNASLLVGLIPEMQCWFNRQKWINTVHRINRLMWKNHDLSRWRKKIWENLTCCWKLFPDGLAGTLLTWWRACAVKAYTESCASWGRTECCWHGTDVLHWEGRPERNERRPHKKGGSKTIFSSKCHDPVEKPMELTKEHPDKWV